MELYEKINEILHNKKITKKEFAEVLISLEPKVNRVSEIPSVQSIYTYLNGRSSIKAELIPYIAEALDISEQELFPDSLKNRTRYLKYILNNSTQSELDMINQSNNVMYNTQAKELIDLLPYIPNALLQSFIEKAKKIKKISLSH